MEEIGATSPTDSSRLAALLDDADVELERIQQQEWVPAEAPPEVHSLRGTLLTDTGRLLAELRSGHPSLALHVVNASSATSDVRPEGGWSA
ncbi:hypothetical protein [Streptomyces sp. NPDC093093]|uniref:hypothetical protein n=1 Tax=Streptomyces sp. NPDC093093 TaxID=3366025 RepID=UPI00382DC5BF